MSAAESASNSPATSRRSRPEVQRYIPGKTRLSSVPAIKNINLTNKADFRLKNFIRFERFLSVKMTVKNFFRIEKNSLV